MNLLDFQLDALLVTLLNLHTLQELLPMFQEFLLLQLVQLRPQFHLHQLVLLHQLILLHQLLQLDLFHHWYLVHLLVQLHLLAQPLMYEQGARQYRSTHRPVHHRCTAR
jgi:hypothetical protein